VRVDGAIFSGYEVQPYYEPMMSKLIVHARDRQAAIETMNAALHEYVIKGVVTNIPLIERVLESRPFAQGTYHTATLEQLINEPEGHGAELVAALAVAMVLSSESAQRSLPSRWKMHGRRLHMVNQIGNGML
jgi:acetyl/propionyl-CoA carboxylase alpha subunit